MIELTAAPSAKREKSPKRKGKVWTQAEFRLLPEGPPFFELEEGVLLEMARPRGRHQKIIGKVYSVISAHVEPNKLGEIWPEVEVDLTPMITYVPDLSYLATEHLTRFANDIAIQGAPDLVVEVLSPSTAVRDKSRKLITYQKTAVPWYWLIDEDLLIIEYKNTPEGFLLTQIVAPPDPFTPQLFPGLTLNLAELMGETEAILVEEEDQHE
ncbi:MAG: Uma2 family endonuclease [Anaerolineae bacterium]|nr:Uma2 family endonuclease [Anaerolineae bacterium]